MQSRAFERSRPTILIITANPNLGGSGGGEVGDAGKLALDQELAYIQRELLLMAPHRDFELVWADAVTVDDVMRLLIKLNPIALHFAGHGVISRRDFAVSAARCRDVQAADDKGDAGIILLDEHGHPEPVTAVALAEMIESAAPAVRLLLLNACYSEAQAGVLSGVVDAVVTMNGPIRDESARLFAAAFYRALGYRRPVGTAFSQAKATLAGKGCPDADLPRLHTRNGVRANDIVLARGARWPRLDTGRLRKRVRRQARRGVLLAATVAAAMIGGWAAVATFVLTDDDATATHTRPTPPAGTPPTHRGPSEAEPEVLVPLPRPRVEDRGPPTGSVPQTAAPGAPPPAPGAANAPLPAPHATPVPGAPGAPLPALPSSSRPAQRTAAPAEPVEPIAVPAEPVESVAAPAEPVKPVAAPAKPVKPDLAPAKPVEPDLAPAKPVEPDAEPAKPAQLDDTNAPGELDREIVRRYVLRHHDPIRHCYEQQRMARPALAGKVLAQFDITPGGSVASATARGLGSAVDSCVTDAIKEIEFPRSDTGVHVNYMFDFRPAAAPDAPCPTTAAGSCSTRP